MTASGAAQPLSFRDGLVSAAPVIIAYVPIGFSFGITATSAGLNLPEALLMSLVIYSGAAQFLGVALFVSGAPLVIAAITLMAMNLRHLLYGPALIKAARAEGQVSSSWIWGFGLTDEVFGAALGRLGLGDRKFSQAFMAGIGLAAYLAWSGGTALGAWAGGGALDDYPVIHSALLFLYPAMFLSFLLSILSRSQAGTVAVSSLVTIVGTALVSAATGILAGMLGGAVVGALWQMRRERGK